MTKKEYMAIYRKTINGLVTQIYNHQKSSSKTRGHSPPSYSRQEFKDWIYSQSEFNKIYEIWKDSDYQSNFRPSVDRMDVELGYSIDNIQLMTWKENNAKGRVELSGVRHHNYRSKEHYTSTSATRGSFKRACRRHSWVFDNFIETYSGEKILYDKKYYYKETKYNE